ncbi:Na+/H+ antiporter NhaA [Sneathiella limimaris]|uniref:Na+/H+ antiporter NhaA n=1 Tax=Sneathiella limimaris TaxID=1964213 RepID=UPI00146E493D|nr:Na+/H+ antiporter NhaA [Sneathiella limimaris]
MQNQGEAYLPSEFSHHFTRPLARFVRIESVAGTFLFLALVLAMILANSNWSEPFESFWEISIGLHFADMDFSRSLRHWTNEGLMTLFFFVISLELKRQIVLGELQRIRIAMFPIMAALGGMVVPVLLYLIFMYHRPGMNGWGTVMATDTAFVIGCLALFGSRVPSSLRLFLLSLAIFDDLGAILVMTIGYGGDLNWNAIVIGGLGLGAIAILARLGLRSVPVYFVLGAGIWLCFDSSGIHPTICGVVLGLMTPTKIWVSGKRMSAMLGRVFTSLEGEEKSSETASKSDLRQLGRAFRETLSPVERLEHMLHPWVGLVILPLFALANTGIAIGEVHLASPVSMAIIVSLVFGKPIGVISFSWFAVQCRIAVRGEGLSWSLLVAGAFLTGIGFTMSFFIANLAFNQEILDSAKLGILVGSMISAFLGIMILVLIVVRNSYATKLGRI